MRVVGPSVGLILSRGTETKNHEIVIAFTLEPVRCPAGDDKTLVLFDDPDNFIVSRVELGLSIEHEPDGIAAVMRMEIGLPAMGDHLNAAGDEVRLCRGRDNLAVLQKLRSNIKR